MSRKLTGFGLAILIAVGVSVTYTGWGLKTSAANAICGLCGRSIHARHVAVGLTAEQKPEKFCCVTCALIATRQDSGATRIVKLTDYLTVQPMEPSAAYLVLGSNVNVCRREFLVTNQFKEAAMIEYDRCSPNIIAFSREDVAEAFRREHGGRLSPFNDVQAMIVE